jgi:hypothetical protein
MRPWDYEEPPKANVSGYNSQEAKPPREIFLKDEEVVIFFNNSSQTPNLLDAEEIYLEDLWDIREKIK